MCIMKKYEKTCLDIDLKADLSPRHAKFVELCCNGESAVAAYKSCGYNAKKNSVESNAYRLYNKPEIKAAIAAECEIASANSRLSKDDLIKYLTDVIMTPPGEVDESSPLAQEVRRDGTVKMVNKFNAIKLLVKMCGWDAPEEEEVELSLVDSVVKYVRDCNRERRKKGEIF